MCYTLLTEARALRVARRATDLELSAIQLATRLGKQRILEHILESRWQVQWR